LLTEVKGDILDIISLDKLMEGITEVYHCAAIISFDPAMDRKMYRVNVEGTANVVNAAVSAGVRKLVHMSSVSALQRLREDEPVNETMLWIPGSPGSKYGQSKFYSELEVWRGMAEGLQVAIVNPSIILGAGEPDESSVRIFSRVYKGLRWYTEGSTGFVDVRDVAASMIMIMDSDVVAERFIISSDNAAFRDIINMIADAFGRARPVQKVSGIMTSFLWRLESLRARISGNTPLITRETAQSAHARVSFDNSKLLRFFPSFRYLDLGNSVKETCALLKSKWDSKK
jgi:nucleoside-diphosphate-sugar epimerase